MNIYQYEYNAMTLRSDTHKFGNKHRPMDLRVSDCSI